MVVQELQIYLGARIELGILAVLSFFSRRSGRHKVAQQSVQWTVGILRHFRALSTPEQNPALGVLSRPAPPPLTQTVGTPLA
jgi:hypothetical protein